MPVYEEFYPARPRKPDRLSAVIPWRSMIAPGVMLQKLRHGLQRSYVVRGPDMMGLSPEVQGALMLQVNEVVKRLGGQWMVQSEAQRGRVTTLPSVAWPSPLLTLLDQERRHQLLVEPGSRESQYYMTLSWTPPTVSMRTLGGFFVTGQRPDVVRQVEQAEEGLTPAARVSLLDFVHEADYFMDLLKGMLGQCRPLTTEETTTYLHNCVSQYWHELGPMAFYTDLDAQLCDTPLAGGWYPQLGDWHLRTCSLMGYPAKSVVGAMRHLDAANLDYRWCTRWLGMEKQVQSSLLRRTQGAWVGQEKTLFGRMAERIDGQPQRILNTDATNKAEEVDAARQEIGADIVAYGDFTSTITVWDTDPAQAETKQRYVLQTLQNQGFTAKVARQDATASWLSSQPGNRLDNVHRSHHNSLFLAHVAPGVTAAWPGPERDEHFKAGPWFYAHTEFNTLFRVVNHLRDLGHFLVLGKTRSGKSTLANFLRAQWMQYRNAQAKVFDLDGHARLLTYLLGGSWHDLGSPSLRFQPLRHVDDPVRRGIALQWLLDLLADFGIPLSAGAHAFLSGNLTKLAALPVQERTLSRLLVGMADHTRHVEMSASSGRIDAQGISHPDTDLKALAVLQLSIRQTLHQFAAGGEYGGIFDGTEDVLGAHPVQTFELRSLLQRPQLVAPVLGYVFPEVERQMRTTHPMFLLLDDAAVAWLTPREDHTEQVAIRRKLEKWLRDQLMTSAKKNVSVGIATHSLDQVFHSPLGALLQEQCASRFFLPMAEAMEPDIAAIYMRLGLTENAIRTIATSRPQRDVYYVCKEMGQRPFSLPLGPLGVSCFARNTAEDHALMDEILAQEGREGFAAGWLRANGFEKEAQDVAAHTTDLWSADTRGTAAQPGEAWDALARE